MAAPVAHTLSASAWEIRWASVSGWFGRPEIEWQAWKRGDAYPACRSWSKAVVARFVAAQRRREAAS